MVANPTVKQGLPDISTPVINPDGTMNLTWYRFFLSVHSITGMWTLPLRKLGDDTAQFANPLPLYISPAGGYPYGAVKFYNPAFPQSILHSGNVILTAP